MEQNLEPFQGMINLQQKILKCWLLLKNNGSLHRTTACIRSGLRHIFTCAIAPVKTSYTRETLSTTIF